MNSPIESPYPEQAIIIGAGPAGLTAALELLRRTDIVPIVLEASHEIGGISRTIRYKGNRMDIGGHRFFSKSDRVMNWWTELMPIDAAESETTDTAQAVHEITYRGRTRSVSAPIPAYQSQSAGRRAHPNYNDDDNGGGICVAEEPIEESAADSDRVMLVRPRKSRIYYLRRFFDYPITLAGNTLRNLGVTRMVRVGFSYISAQARPIKNEKSLEDFLINRFGRELYLTFFKSYTEKVWGTPCNEISAEWGAQRIKGLSLTTALKHFIGKAFRRNTTVDADAGDLAQKKTDTSLIERFMYPKFGPGQLWEHVADLVAGGIDTSRGFRSGKVHTGWKVRTLHCEGDRVTSVEAINDDGETHMFAGEYFFSTMPVRELIQAIDAPIPANVQEVSDGLQYRDFITVGLLVDRLKVKEQDGSLLKDTWIYIQEPDVLLGRLQIFNNWSPYLVEDPTKVWIGLEYFCYDTDDLWKMADDDLKRFAAQELAKIGLIEVDAVSDAHVVRVPKTYPAYFGTYDRFSEVRTFTDSFENLFLIGRNGMHKYNNQDHSMLTAMTVVDGLEKGFVDKAALWEINTEQNYHEEKK